MNGADPDRPIRLIVYAVVGLVAAFAFFVSFTHIYDLGRANGQHGWAARLLPLSVDLLIVAASAVVFLQSRTAAPPAGLARFLPRLLLWAGIGATVAANVAYGLPYGPVGAAISAWPGAVFAGLVEMVMVAVRPAAKEVPSIFLSAAVRAGPGLVPATAAEAATVAYAASVAGGNPLPARQLVARYGISRTQADRIRKTDPALNGSASHE